jgi:methyltransferase (TIGR00027 family)
MSSDGGGGAPVPGPSPEQIISRIRHLARDLTTEQLGRIVESIGESDHWCGGHLISIPREIDARRDLCSIAAGVRQLFEERTGFPWMAGVRLGRQPAGPPQLPTTSNLMSVGQLRYIQAQYEADGHRNPDLAVGAFLTARQRLGCMLRGRLLMSRLRRKPFYHYVLARTRYYDTIFMRAIAERVACIVNIGCGSDTRAHRFAGQLRASGTIVYECDQPSAISAKRVIAQKHWRTDHIRYVPLDLNRAAWPELDVLLTQHSRSPALVMMEGVSPYIERVSFQSFLRVLATRLHRGSTIAYDFKMSGQGTDADRSSRASSLFRLPAELDDVAAFHAAMGLRLEHSELSSALSMRLVPDAAAAFGEDCLLRLRLPRVTTR